MILDKFSSLKYKEFCPTIEDIENEAVKELAERLKADSDRETLNNILEWQDRNLSFWWERWPFKISLNILTKLIVIVIFFISLSFILLAYEYVSWLLIPFLVVLILLIGMLVSFRTFPTLILIFSSLSIVYPLLNIVLRVPDVANTTLLFTMLYGGCLGASALILLYLSFTYRNHLTGHIFEKIPQFIEMVNDTFQWSLPVQKILEHRLAICKDYAKLTGALLLNLYQDTTIYYFKIPLHVAADIHIDDEYYILDQHLPIRTKNSWLRSWEKDKATVYKAKLRRNSDGEPSEIECGKKENISISETPQKTVDLQKLTDEIAKTLDIKQNSQKKKPNLETVLQENYAMHYENDEIIFHSIVRSIINKLENELCADTDNITQIELIEEADDLLVHVYLP